MNYDFNLGKADKFAELEYHKTQTKHFNLIKFDVIPEFQIFNNNQ